MSKEFRMPQRVMVLGGSGAGKSSLIQSLKNGHVQLAKYPTDGVAVTPWAPHESYQAGEILRAIGCSKPESIQAEFWDTTGRKCCWPIHQENFTPSAFYMVVFNWQISETINSAITLCRMVQYKCPGTEILLVCNGPDTPSGGRESKVAETLRAIQSAENDYSNMIIEELNKIREWSACTQVMSRIIQLEEALTRPLRIYPIVPHADLSNGKGFDECMRVVLLNLAAKLSDTEQLSLPEELDASTVLEKLTRLRKCHNIILKSGATELTHYSPLFNYLQYTGAIIKSAGDKGLVCVNPQELANASCLIHVDDLKKNFRFEAYRFWPKESGCRRPDLSTLVKALEDIPTNGMVREVLFPLLWQETSYTEEQIKLMVQILIEKNFILSCEEMKTPQTDYTMDELKLPNYPNLSAQACYYLPALGNANSSPPTVNWSAQMFPGDIQLGFIYTFHHHCSPEPLFRKILAQCNAVSNYNSYKYFWKEGLLCKYNDEVMTHVYFDQQSAPTLHVSSRGAYEGDTDILPMLWLSSKPLLAATESVISHLPGLYYEIVLDVQGAPLLTACSSAAASQTPHFSLWECVYHHTKGSTEIIRDGWTLNLTLLFNGITVMDNAQSWLQSINHEKSLPELIRVYEPKVDTLPRKSPATMRHKVSWHNQLTQEVDMNAKKYEEEHKDHIISDKIVRRQIRHIASALVTAVLSSAMAEVIVSKKLVSEEQEPLVKLIAGAIQAGQSGQTDKAIETITKITEMARAQDSEKQNRNESRVCVIL